MSLWTGPEGVEYNEGVSAVLWRVGIPIIIAGAGVQVGLIIGAETTAVTIISPAATPGWFGPPVRVGPSYQMYWEASQAAAIVGLFSMAAAVVIDMFQGSSAK
jgi:hypothetical protein